MWKDIHDLLREEPLQLTRVLATCLNLIKSWTMATTGTPLRSPLSCTELIPDPQVRMHLDQVEWLLLKTLTKFDEETGNELPTVRDNLSLITQMYGLPLLADGYEKDLLMKCDQDLPVKDLLEQKWKYLVPYDATFSKEDVLLACSLLNLP
jgi:hypothetical protein